MADKHTPENAGIWETLNTPVVGSPPFLDKALTPIGLSLPLLILAFGGSKKLVKGLLGAADKVEEKVIVKRERDKLRKFVESGITDSAMGGVVHKFAEFSKQAEDGKGWLDRITSLPGDAWRAIKNNISDETSGAVRGATDWALGRIGTGWDHAGPLMLMPGMAAAAAMLVLGAHNRRARKLRSVNSLDAHEREMLRGLRDYKNTSQTDRLRDDLLDLIKARKKHLASEGEATEYTPPALRIAKRDDVADDAFKIASAKGYNGVTDSGDKEQFYRGVFDTLLKSGVGTPGLKGPKVQQVGQSGAIPVGPREGVQQVGQPTKGIISVGGGMPTTGYAGIKDTMPDTLKQWGADGLLQTPQATNTTPGQGMPIEPLAAIPDNKFDDQPDTNRGITIS